MRSLTYSIAAAGIVLGGIGPHSTRGAANEPPVFRIRVEGHAWRPPFGLDRIGKPVVAVVQASAVPESFNYALVSYRSGKEIRRQALVFSAAGLEPSIARATLLENVDELTLIATTGTGGESKTLVRQVLQRVPLEAEAIARPDTAVNPVDLGTVLVPNGWLLLGPEQAGVVDFAALSRSKDLPGAHVRIWFQSVPTVQTTSDAPLRDGRRTDRHLRLPEAPKGIDRDTLHVRLDDDQGNELWQKTIPVMLVQTPPRWPTFGATVTKLRFDAPISVRDPKTGTFSSLKYEDGWDPSLKDVVVSFPNGARYVFWRGSSYIPFWAGRFNTGACYEWAEILSRFPDAVDCVEPLMDKELRYGRVEIVESTSARVHVRWTYLSTDLHYKVWGDSAVEDYYFYPDGFGTRVLTLKSDPAHDYELSEFIVLTPQGTYPLDVLPTPLVSALFLDGRKLEFPFPHVGGKPAFDPRNQPAAYRLRLHKDDPATAVYFNANETQVPPVIFGPFYDGGEMVTPCYWGSHWPLARGNATGSKIDDRIHLTPTHNSVMSWAQTKPTPLKANNLTSTDTLGRSKPMLVRTWAWMIGMTDAPDASLLARARSFARPPSLEVRGGRLEAEPYATERRAHRIRVDERNLSIRIRADRPCVNPVFELSGAPEGPIRVALTGRALDPSEFAWDGRVLYVDTTLGRRTVVNLTFVGVHR